MLKIAEIWDWFKNNSRLKFPGDPDIFVHLSIPKQKMWGPLIQSESHKVRQDEAQQLFREPVTVFSRKYPTA